MPKSFERGILVKGQIKQENSKKKIKIFFKALLENTIIRTKNEICTTKPTVGAILGLRAKLLLFLQRAYIL